MKKITIYSTNSCGVCQELVPLIRTLAKKKGVPVSVIDVEKCGKPCDSIRYVPLIEVDGRQTNDIEGLIRKLI